MTPEQVARRKGLAYALIGAGIASFYMAYQYLLPVTGRAEPPPAFAPLLFGGIGLICLVVGAVLALKAGKLRAEGTPVDLSGAKGRPVKILLAIGFIALVGSYFVDGLVPNDEILGMLLSVGLIVVMIICFLVAARMAKKLRNDSKTGADK